MNPHGPSLLLLVSIAWAQSAPGEVAEKSPEEPPEEIVVYGKSMAHLRNERYRTEERVFSIFNSLNSDDEYDIHCGYRAATGSLFIRQRVCEANFVGNATSAEAFSLMMRRPAVPASTVIRRKNKLLLEEMRRLAAEHPELGEALAELADVGDRTESLKRDRVAGRRE